MSAPNPDSRTHPAIKALAAAIGVSLLAMGGFSFYESSALSERLQDPAPGELEKARRENFSKKGMGREALREAFQGISTNGQIIQGLFPIRTTGVSTAPVQAAAEAFLAALSPEERARTTFVVNDIEWRDWMNVHMYPRKGVSLRGMTPAQREVAMALVRASLSAKGLKTAVDIMKLNHTLGELLDNLREFGDDLYFFTVMGTPSATEPWGWQLDGHHLIVNYFVLGDQVVMTPTFLGSEPTVAASGKYQGTEVLQVEQNKGLAFVNTLTEAQQKAAIIATSKGGNSNLTEAFKDNVVLDYAGIKATEFTDAQKDQFLDLIGEYVGKMDDGHAQVKMDDVRSHLANTYFAWVGQYDAASVFYYRIQSPVVLIEFDHQNPGPLGIGRRGPPPGGPDGPGGPVRGRGPTRQHIHAVIRTPNGNDYGKDLLRQHYEQHPHTN